VSLILGLFVGFSASPGHTDEPSSQATQLRERIKQRETEIDQLRSRREQLEKTASLQSRELKQYDVQFRRYIANLENSVKRSEPLERELLSLLERAHERESLLQIACQLAGQDPSPTGESLRLRAISIVASLHQQEMEEQPIRQDLQKKIEAEQSYRQRIQNRYMANDQMRRRQIEKQLAGAQNKAKANLEAEQRIAAELQDLRRSLKALDEQLAQIRKQSEKKARSSQAPQAPFQPGRPFIQLRGRLPWPAPGTVVRGYGPFTHPTLGVKLESKGIDVSVESGTSIRAVADGRVLYVGVLERYGPIVALDHGDGYLSVYGNVEANKMRIGQMVPAGDPIGVVGHSDPGNDLVYHFEIRRGDRALDPSTWLAR
jgi:septal ring factor EnvC (AmiA/AmiB activator)